NTSRDKGIELRVRQAFHNWGGGGLELSRHQRRNQAHELDRIKHGHCLERRLAESLPRLAQIAEEVLRKFIARARRPTTRVSGLARFPGDQSSLPVFPHC